MAERVSQGDLSDLNMAEASLRSNAEVIAESSHEPGDFAFSHSAYEQLKRVPPLVRRRDELTPLEAAQDATRAIGEEFAFGDESATLRCCVLRVTRIWLRLGWFYVSRACRRAAVRARLLLRAE